MTRVRAAIGTAALLGILLIPFSDAQAGGFSIYEQGARAMGRASAFVASPDDPSAVFYNPAGLALLDGTLVMVGSTVVAPIGKFYGVDPFPGYGVEERLTYQFFYLPNIYLSHRISDRMVVGLGIMPPFGLGTAWHHPNTFSGRYLATKTDLQTISINPTVAWSASDKLQLGLGFNIRYSKLYLQRYVGTFDPNANLVRDVATATLESDFSPGFGFNLGLLFAVNDRLDLGLAYRHGGEIEYTGTGTFEQITTGDAFIDGQVSALLGDGQADLKTRIDLPYVLTIGAAYQLTDDLLGEFDLNWWGWSSFDRLTSEGLADDPDSGLEDIDTPENYEDTFEARIGLEYLYTDRLTLRAGYLYDHAPVPVESITPLLPDADRHALTFGVGYDFGRFIVDGALMYLNFDDADTKGRNPDGFNGVYDQTAWLAAFNITYPIGR
jgi:long-chain fatty acid transport protein